MKIVETDRQDWVWSVEFTDMESQALARFDEYLIAGLGIRAAALRALLVLPRAVGTADFVTHLSGAALALDSETGLVVVT